MKEKLIQEDTNGGIKRDKIFEVLNKKGNPTIPCPKTIKPKKR